jgi:hypothetical protein
MVADRCWHNGGYSGAHLGDNGVQRQGAVAADELDNGPASARLTI